MVKKFFDNWVVSLVFLALVAVLVLGGYHLAIKPNLGPVPGGSGGGVASDSCILCHTDETVIAASTFGQDEDEEEEASGG